MTARFCADLLGRDARTRAVVLLLCLIAGSSARADDTSPQLAKARHAYRNTVDKATIGLLDAFDAAIKAATASGNFDAVKALRAEKDAFELSGKVPTSARLKSALAAYNLATKSATAALEKAFEQEVKELTKAGKIEQAETAQKELKEFRLRAAVSLRPADVTTKEDLRHYLIETSWAWGNSTFKADGLFDAKDWKTSTVRWEAVDRRTVVLWVEKGRNFDRMAVVVFNEDLTEFRGFDFNGKDRLPAYKRKP